MVSVEEGVAAAAAAAAILYAGDDLPALEYCLCPVSVVAVALAVSQLLVSAAVVLTLASTFLARHECR